MGARLIVRATNIAGVSIVQTEHVSDNRGAFSRFFCERELASPLGCRHIVQINHSRTEARGALRGLHYQRPPHAEMKLVRCLSGRVWDVALDLRHNSPTFMQWHAEELSCDNACMLIIPEGCAHGFQTLEPACELLYLHTAAYEKSAEGGVRHDDPRAGIAWPIAITEISERDRSLPLLPPMFSGIPL